MAASALRLRGSTTPIVGSLGDEPIGDRGAEDAADDREAGVDRGGREYAHVIFLTHASTCERRIERSGMSPKVTPAVARSAFSRVDDTQT